jgi:hypothetical protein
MSIFAREWLKLRESADLGARDAALARQFGAALPRRTGKPLRLIDLGAGGGANCRALLPRIGGDQDWILIDRDRDLLAAQTEEFTLWARRQGYPILAGGGRVMITAGKASWAVTSMLLDLARDQTALAALDADGVTASALFDLVSSRWLDDLVAFLAERRVPLFAALTVDGQRIWDPALADDAILAEAFQRHQATDKGFGPALGGAAPRALAKALAAEDFRVTEAASDWHLDARDRVLLDELIAGEARAAREIDPERSAIFAAWEKQRRDQLENGRLKLTIGHRDLLALPG